MLLIFPPQWTPVSPHYALPSLLGQLKANGYNAKAIDLNIDFYDNILSKKQLENAIETAKIQFEELKSQIVKIYSPNKKENDYTFKEKIIFYKYNYLKNYFNKNGARINSIPLLIDSAKQTFKTEDFYKIIKCYR